MSTPPYGSISWRDLTVDDATSVKDFYAKVVGWETDEADLGDYSDWVIKDETGEPVGGICHAKGPNADLPAQWLIYITVEDLDESIKQCEALGGEVVAPKRDMGGYGMMCVIKDPAGAVSALIQPQ